MSIYTYTRHTHTTHTLIPVCFHFGASGAWRFPAAQKQKQNRIRQQCHSSTRD